MADESSSTERTVPAPPPPAPPQANRSEPSEAEIAAILARVEEDHRSRFPGSDGSGGFSGVGFRFGPATLARVLLSLAGLVLIQNGLDGMRTRAIAQESLLATSINHRGGQSLGLGLAVLGLAAMPMGGRRD